MGKFRHHDQQIQQGEFLGPSAKLTRGPKDHFCARLQKVLEGMDLIQNELGLRTIIGDAHVLDSGGQRPTTLRGLANINKRYLGAIIGFNLGLTCGNWPESAARRLVGPWALGHWLRECLDGLFRPAASHHTPWQENAGPAPRHARHFPIFTPASRKAAYSTGS